MLGMASVKVEPKLEEGATSEDDAWGGEQPSDDDDTKTRQKKSQYKKWNREDLVEAMKLAKKGKNVRKAALKFGIPNTTLKTYIERGSAKKPRNECILTEEEEQQLVAYIKFATGGGKPPTSTYIRTIATRMLRAR